MRYATSLLVVLLASLSCLASSVSQAQPLVALTDQNPIVNLETSGLHWIDEGAAATIGQVAGRKGDLAMQPMQPDTIYKLGARGAVWQHYRLGKSAESQQTWLLEFPLPLLDLVTVFQKDKEGRWTSQTAGDTVPVSSWPEPGRHAQFVLDLPAGAAQDIYVRIQHLTEVNIPVNVITAQAHHQQQQVDYLIIGVVFGALLLLIVAGAAQSWVYSDRAYAGYAAYAASMMLVVASTSGMAGHLLWSHSAAWNNTAQGALALVGGGAALLVIRKLCEISGRHRGFDQVVYAMGLAGPLLAWVYAGLDRTIGVHLLGGYLVIAVMLGIGTAIVAWRRQDEVGAWVLAAFTPLALTTLLLMARTFGWLPTTWISQYALMLSMAIEVPLLLVALNIRTQERHGVEAREQAMSSKDALTGLLAGHIFNDRLHQVVARAKRYREPAAVVFVELVNYGYIKRTYGAAIAEQNLLRSVIKLRRILRDGDTVGRVDEARFGLIMEGVSSRAPVTELAARLIAAGLMPLKGLKPEVILQFHAAGVLLTERMMSGPELSKALAGTLAAMAARTRRPIRFLEPESTRPMPLESDSGGDDWDDDSQPAFLQSKL